MYARLSRRFPHYQKTWISPSSVPKLQTIHCWHPMLLSMSIVNDLPTVFEFLQRFILGSKFQAELIGTHSIHSRKTAVFLIGYEAFNKRMLKAPHLQTTSARMT